MTRRSWLMAAAAAPLFGDSAQQACDALAAAASALGRDNASAFLSAFDPAIPGFESVRTNVNGLLAVWNVQSSIDLVENGGADDQPVLELNWLLNLTMRNDAARTVRTRYRVKCRFVKQAKRWRIVEFSPLEMFAPPKV